MFAPGPPALFLGDLDDPWVAAIADALPGASVRWSCPDALPEADAWSASSPAPPVLVVHRAHLTGPDSERLRRLRLAMSPVPKVVVCVGPHARYHDVQRWSLFVDAILSEATASEVIARHVVEASEPRLTPARRSRAPVAVLSTNTELRSTLADLCRASGFPVVPARDWAEVSDAGLAVWDVPMLEADWPDRLARETQAHRRLVLALLGLADRATVRLARGRGAAACLDLPCATEDLVFVLDRLTGQHLASRTAEAAHVLPPAPTTRPRAGARTADRGDPEALADSGRNG